MFKKIFAAAVLALFMLTAQIAFAEIPIDWSKVQRIGSKSELALYIESEQRKGNYDVAVVLTNGLTVSSSDLIVLCPAFGVRQISQGGDGQNTFMLYKLQEYPGTKVANAYLSDSTFWLNAEEKKLYDVAVDIVNKINKEKYLEDRAIRIYEEIMNRTSFVSGDMSHQPRFVSAIGALIDGKANCQGYSDAFYMLGRMCGLNVGRISGTANGEPHMWNTVNYRKDGMTYFIDVTWGDMQVQHGDKYYNGYIYFNAPVEIMQVTHTWDWSSAPPNLQPSIDYEYSYSKWWRGNLARVTSAEAGLELLAKKLSDGKHTWFSVMTPYDERYSPENSKQIIDFVSKALTAKIRVNVNWRKYGKYMFYTGRII